MQSQNLTPFTSENQPPNRGRKKGIPNASTVLKKYVETPIQTINPLTGEIEITSVARLIALNIIAELGKN